MVKRILICAIISIGVCVGNAYAEFYRTDIQPKVFNDVWKKFYPTGMQIEYSKGEFYFVVKQTLGVSLFVLDRAQADALIAAIDKYKEWNLKASKKGVKLEKLITALPAKQGGWKIGDGDWHWMMGFEYEAHFFSQTKDYHQLVIVFPKFVDMQNSYVDSKPSTLYFDYKVALALRDALRQESVEKWLKDMEKQKAIEAEFN